jgi:hypothetical protein
MAPSTPPASMGGIWTEKQKIIAPDGALLDGFSSVSVDGDTAIIGAYYDDDNGADSGSAYVFTRTDHVWTQQAKLLASDGAPGDFFGSHVSLDGDTVLIGADADDNSKGSVYVFTCTGAIWTQQAKLLASDGVAGDNFSRSMSIYGNTAIIGALKDDDNGLDSGSAYVFTRTGTTWTQQAKLLALDGTADDNFGISVSIYGDTALIGTSYYPSGAAYVFTRTGTTWTQQKKILPSDETTGFGSSVSLDRDTALIGAAGDDEKGFCCGAAYVFTRTDSTWTQQAKLLPSDGKIIEFFGWSVSLSGNTALIGANADSDNGLGSGSAYVFTRTGTTWTQQQKLLASDGKGNDGFGWYVSLDDNTALVGSPGNNLKGAVYAFERANLPPPTITGPSSGKAGVATNYNFITTDHDEDNVYYFIDWGDGTNSSWIGPYSSGEQITKSHTWSTKGKYTVKAKAKDTNGYESDWATLTVTMPKIKPMIHQNVLLKKLTIFFSILEKIINRK